MDEQRPVSLAALNRQREQTIERLCTAFAEDVLTDTELEERLDLVHRAVRPADLERLIADLPAPAAGAAPEAGAKGSRAPVPLKPRRSRGIAFAFWGGSRRRGQWQPPEHLLASAIMGGVHLDFRDAILPPGETVVSAFAFWGGVDVIVPPDVRVEVDGIALLGGFDLDDEGSDPPPDAPILRVDGVAIMGGVSVRVRERGEPDDDEDSHRRRAQRRLEQQERRLAARRRRLDRG